MDDLELVHWHDGMFLQPHHLQAMQAGLLGRQQRQTRRARAYPCGVWELALDEEALGRHQVILQRLHAVLPSGEEVRMPGNARVPALAIKGLFDNDLRPATIYAALPLRNAGGPDVAETEETIGVSKRLYALGESHWLDENEGGSEEPLPVRRANLRLVTDRDDTTDLELLPLLRLKPAQPDAVEVVPALDTEYAPPCLSLGAHPALAALADKIIGGLANRREELRVQIQRIGYAGESLGGTVLEKILRQRSVGRALARIEALRQDPRFGPFELYVELRGLLGELAPLAPGQDFFGGEAYRHEDAIPVFADLLRRIGNLLADDASGTYLRIPFAEREHARLWEAALDEEPALRAEELYLAVRCGQESTALAALFEDGNRFKLTAGSMRDARVRGLPLSEERHPPTALPALPDTVWFRVGRGENEALWRKMRDEKCVVAVCHQSVMVEAELSLFLTFGAD